MGRQIVRAGVGGVVAASLVMAGPLPAARGQAPATTTTRLQYEACQTREEQGFRTAIDAVTLQALKQGLAGLDYRAIVAAEWRRNNIDELMSRRVDAAIDELREETSWWELLGSLASKERAERLASSAAERVYRSDSIKTAIESLASVIGKEVGKRMELATIDAAEPATQCLQAFLGPRYGTTVARVVSREAGKEFAIDPARNAPGVSTGQVLAEGGEGIAGAIILIVRRQLSNMASRIGQRLVGAVLGRLVSIVAGGVGAILIAKDIYDLRHGVLPIIASEMKSPATRDKVQDELAKSIGEQINEQVRDLSGKTADRIIEIWHEFRRAHAKVLEIAEKNDDFRRFIDTVRQQNLARLDEVVGLILASEGEPAVLRRLSDGTLHEAVERLPGPAFEVARDLRSLDLAFKWQALAGDRLGRVIEYEIHRLNGPQEFTRASLARLLALDDPTGIKRLAALKGPARDTLLELADPELKHLARGLGGTELASLAGYMTSLERDAGQRLLAAVAINPAKMHVLTGTGVRDAILASRDQAAAVGLMLKADGLFDVGEFINDVSLVRGGRISPWLLWARYPTAIGVLGMIGLVLLLVLWRMLFGRRPKVIIAAGGGKR